MAGGWQCAPGHPFQAVAMQPGEVQPHLWSIYMTKSRRAVDQGGLRRPSGQARPCAAKISLGHAGRAPYTAAKTLPDWEMLRTWVEGKEAGQARKQASRRHAGTKLRPMHGTAGTATQPCCCGGLVNSCCCPPASPCFLKQTAASCYHAARDVPASFTACDSAPCHPPPPPPHPPHPRLPPTHPPPTPTHPPTHPHLPGYSP